MARSVDDTDNCPLLDHCATCGSTDELAVATIETPVGVYCTTLCGDCGEDARVNRPPGWAAAMDLVARHCEHLGVDLDEMAALLETERGRSRG